ncbi:MAG: DUF6429 family protein [Dongiaceae bacterium]
MAPIDDDDKDALSRAQDKAYDAMEAADRRTRRALARQALAISPLCADAHYVLAGEAATPDEAVAGYRRAVEVGRQVLGEAFFERHAGEFWRMLETRPYMRACQGLALALWGIGEREEAIGHYRDMLRLNPNDNQGIRYLLLDALIALGRDEEAARVLDRYEGDGSAGWTWSGALLAFRREGDTARSRKALARAVAANEHVPPYLAGGMRAPRRLPDYVSVGSRDEAAAYVADSAEAWDSTEGARAWVAEALASPGSAKRHADDEPELDLQRIDDAVLALLLLGRHDGDRVWKSFDWDAMDRLHAKGLISRPAGRAKSVALTEEGAREAERLLRLLFAKPRA